VRRVEDAVDDLDVTVKHIRSAIFRLEPRADRSPAGVRSRVLDLVREAGPMLGAEPSVLFEGPVDSATPEPVATDMLATLREALSNVARHAGASHVEIVVTIDEAELVMRVTDDGIGPPAPGQPRGHGLDNMQARAERRGGSLALRQAASHGTVVEWRVPCK
jgi:signal transduction histidine kinase